MDDLEMDLALEASQRDIEPVEAPYCAQDISGEVTAMVETVYRLKAIACQRGALWLN